MKRIENVDQAFDDYLAFLERITPKPQAELPPQTIDEVKALFDAGDVQRAQAIILQELEKDWS